MHLDQVDITDSDGGRGWFDGLDSSDVGLKVDATRSGGTGSVLLSRVQLDRLIYELTYIRWRVMTKGQPSEGYDNSR
ncbi:hypothetical protein Vqi01_14340 [Micromonospora qiuiae]|uniref:Uncharacterized protein n=1 Tax=Micromonospora qiuiae TaxID=502268 RepID=A0ABQ4J7W4_9ACTN|nr:hypothetical protein [Micromonospora qiuiae]GIJ26272.1 hypothetical protein Vqi01_14340 [Micromonospora qiuiae]